MQSNILQLDSIKDTTLWQILNKQKDDQAQIMAKNLLKIADEAFEELKVLQQIFPEYTLHDSVHNLRVIEIASMILGENLESLNSVEIYLLILACLFHDHGMIMGKNDYEKLKSSDEYIIFRDTWIIDHPNKLEIEKIINSKSTSDSARIRLTSLISQFDSAILTDYLRKNHGSRSADYIKSNFKNDKRFEVYGKNLSNYIAKLTESHCINTTNITPTNGFKYDELIGLCKINMPFLAVILRLADILDFDSERTPDVLFKSIHFTSDISISEWQKHRGVKGWVINKYEIKFSMYFEHPVYEATARKFLDYIDCELNECHLLTRNFPTGYDNYKLDIPLKVDREQIGPMDNAYIYADLEFSFSRDEIVKLLMTNKLYNSPSLCIRELLQNSLDALRYRKALFGCNDINWENGKVEMFHELDPHGHEVIICKDNGIGMDLNIINNFLGKVGRSYYRSPEFERERIYLRSKNQDFDPCSQFGIGFMSCFMLGDRITIETRRDFGQGKKCGEPLLVEINGLGSLFVIKKGKDDQEIGTTIRITSRKKPSFLDEWTDSVKLITILKGYALCTEFPIYAKCNVKEIQAEIEIPPEIEKPKTIMELYRLSNIVTYEINFNIIDSRLNGYMRESFLLDNSEVPTYENDEGEWIKDKDSSVKWKFLTKNNCFEEKGRMGNFDETTVSIDGIFLCGRPGRESFKSQVKQFLGWSNAVIGDDLTCLIDIRGELKPEITASRKPPDMYFGRLEIGWNRIQYLIDFAQGKIWENVISFCPENLSPREFWQLTTIYKFFVPHISSMALWKFLSISFLDNKKNEAWIKLSEVKALKFQSDKNKLVLVDNELKTIGVSDTFLQWENDIFNSSHIEWNMNCVALLMCKLTIANDIIELIPSINDSNEIPSYFIIKDHSQFFGCYIEFIGNAKEFITVQTPFPIANRNHPLVIIDLESRFVKNKNCLQEFSSTFVRLILSLISTTPNRISINKPGRWAKICAHKYFEVDWSKYGIEYKPPYYVFIPNQGSISIDEEKFKEWAEIEVE